jgi:transposase
MISRGRPKAGVELSENERSKLATMAAPTGLTDAPRSGAPRTITDAKVERVITLTLERKPAHATQWSTRSLAQRCGLAHDAVHRIWRAFGLKPRRQETFQLSNDPLIVERCAMSPGFILSHRRAPSWSASMRRARAKRWNARRLSCHSVPAGPNAPRTTTSGTARSRCLRPSMCRPARSAVVASLATPSITSSAPLKQIDQSVPAGLALHLVLDNYAAHQAPAVRRWPPRHPRFHRHFIPTHSSWLNQVERWFAKITNESIRRGSFRSVPHLRQTFLDHIAARSRAPKQFVCTASAELIRGKVPIYAANLPDGTPAGSDLPRQLVDFHDRSARM